MAERLVPLAARQPAPVFAAGHRDPKSASCTSKLAVDDTAAFTQELHDFVENDRCPFSPRIRAPTAMLAKIRPEPVGELLPPPKVYARLFWQFCS
ncbi:MAG TPA: hypothetical protein VHT21_05330 [Stellaceae bacterium]|nr:hypothetical protein [Stellaceae bacterium]